MKRWAINILCGLSLLIFLLAMGIWVRSYFVADVVMWAHGVTAARATTDAVGCALGAVGIARERREYPVPPGTTISAGWKHPSIRPPESIYQSASPSDRFNQRFLGIQVKYEVTKTAWGSRSTGAIILPLWLFLLFAIPPLLWVVRWRGQRGRGFPVEVNAARAAGQSGGAAVKA